MIQSQLIMATEPAPRGLGKLVPARWRRTKAPTPVVDGRNAAEAGTGGSHAVLRVLDNYTPADLVAPDNIDGRVRFVEELVNAGPFQHRFADMFNIWSDSRIAESRPLGHLVSLAAALAYCTASADPKWREFRASLIRGEDAKLPKTDDLEHVKNRFREVGDSVEVARQQHQSQTPGVITDAVLLELQVAGKLPPSVIEQVVENIGTDYGNGAMYLKFRLFPGGAIR